MPRVNVRRVNEWDAPAMLKIFEPYILGTPSGVVATLEWDVPHIAQLVSRVERSTYTKGWIICEVDGVPAGFAYAAEAFALPGEQWVADLNVYVAPKFQRRGVGSALYTMLLDIMREAGWVTVRARIPLPNDAAIAFHKQFGFAETETRVGFGRKHGRSLDLLTMSLQLNPAAIPDAWRPVKAYLVDNDFYEALRARCEGMV